MAKAFQKKAVEKGVIVELTEQQKADATKDKAMMALYSENPFAWEYKSTGLVALQKQKAGRDAYFEQKPEDSFKLIQTGNKMYNQRVKDKEDQIMQNRMIKEFFKDIFLPLQFNPDDQIGDINDKKALTTSKVKMQRIFRAIRDVSRETQFGMLKEKIHAGLITDYGYDDLDIAYVIYKSIIESDITDRVVTFEILKMAREPETSLDNIVERKVALDPDQMDNRKDKDDNTDQKLQVEMTKTMGSENLDKETIKHIAYFKALNDGQPQSVCDEIRNGKLFEEDLYKFLCDNIEADEFAKFGPDEKYLARKCGKCKQEVYTATDDDSDEGWKSEDGMTHSINSRMEDKARMMLIKGGQYGDTKGETLSTKNSSKGDDFGGGKKGKTLHDQICDIVENIDELSEKAENIKLSRSEYLNCLREVT